MIESYIGIGLRTALSNRLNFKVFGGAGPVYFSAPEFDAKYPGIAMQNNKQWLLGRTFGTGLEYNLKK